MVQKWVFSRFEPVPPHTSKSRNKITNSIRPKLRVSFVVVHLFLCTLGQLTYNQTWSAGNKAKARDDSVGRDDRIVLYSHTILDNRTLANLHI